MKSAEHYCEVCRFSAKAANFKMLQRQSCSETREGQSIQFDNRKFFIPGIPLLFTPIVALHFRKTSKHNA